MTSRRRGTTRRTTFLAHHRKIAVLATALLLLTVGGAIALGPTGAFENMTPTTFAGLAKRGPIDPATHFPGWYRDHAGVALEACLDPNDANCIKPVGAHYDPLKPVSLESSADPALNNFPDEFFYFNATSVVKDGGNPTPPKAGVPDVPTRFLVENNLEGAFANNAPILGDQMVFARFRVKIDAGLRENTKYTFVHPYGTADVRTGAGETGIFVTRDIPLAALDFNGALHTRLGPFLQWDSGAPTGYLGDGVTPHAVIGSPVGNDYVALIGPGVSRNSPDANKCPQATMVKFSAQIGAVADAASAGDPAATAANDCLYNDLLTVMGKKATRSGVDVTRATYTRNADGTTSKLEVFAESNADQNIVAREPDPALRGTATRRIDATLLPGTNGEYFGHVPVRPGMTLPDTVQVLNQTDAPATVKTEKVIDTVTGTATYDGAADGAVPAGPNLHVTAQSSDQMGGGAPVAVLSVPIDGAGNPVADPALATTQQLSTIGTDATTGATTQSFDFTVRTPPASVLVVSKQGGVREIPVDMSKAGDTKPAPLVADAGPPISIVNGPLAPLTVALVGSGSTGDIKTYDWTGPFDVTTDPVTGAATGLGGSTAGPVPTGAADNPNWTVAPPDAPIVPPATQNQYGYQLTVTAPDGNTSTDFMVLTVKPGPDPATEQLVGRARWTPAQARFVIDGTDGPASILGLGNTITVYNGGSTAGAKLGTSPIDLLGNWVVDLRPSPVLPTSSGCSDGTECVTVVSKLGTTITVPVNPRGGGGGGGGGAAAAAVPAAGAGAGAGAAAAAVPGVAAVPVAPVPAVVGAARVAPVPAFAAAALVGAGVPLVVTVPAGAGVLRVRVLTVPGRGRGGRAASVAAPRARVLYRAFRQVPAAGKAHTVRFRLRSRQLYSRVRAGNRYVLEITPGLSRTKLGRPTRTTIRVR